MIINICSSNTSILAATVEGTLTHETDNTPISGAKITIKGSFIYTESDQDGYFRFREDQIYTAGYYQNLPQPSVNGNLLIIKMWETSEVKLFDINGSMLYSDINNNFSYDLSNNRSGIYIVLIETNGLTYKIKIVKNEGTILFNQEEFISDIYLDLQIEKEGYESEEITVKIGEKIDLKLVPRDIDYVTDYSFKIEDQTKYKSLAGNPLNSTFSGVSSVKFVYVIQEDKIYYLNTKKHTSHYLFCAEYLDYGKGLYFFNEEQYSYHPNRTYFLGSIDYFSSSEKYMLQFFASDDISCEDIKKVFNKVISTTYFDDDLYLIPNAEQREKCTSVPVMSLDQLFAGQNYQCLNPEESYWYLKKVPLEIIEDIYISKHDILFINGIPLDLPVVAGIITTEFQPVLSHINVLSHNRGTPNMALRNGWTDEKLIGLNEQLVHLKVGYLEYTIEKANIEEAELYWKIKEDTKETFLSPDYSVDSIIDIDKIRINDVNFCGGKAANFGELTHVTSILGEVPLPDGGFAIPFHFYQQHLIKNGIDTFIIKMLNDADFVNNVVVRKQYLQTLRNKIKDSPLDPAFYNLLINKLQTYNFSNFRFRSSTNAEDIKGFNGAGLYDSKTGDLNDPDKPIDEAVKKVWASLWNFSAFEEREYFKIVQQTVAMGILVHQSFPDEVANGVVITKNLYNPNLQGLTINSQFDEISVVNPEEGYLPEQVLYINFDNAVDYINLSTVPGRTSKVLTREELDKLAIYCWAIQEHYNSLGYFDPLDIEFKVIFKKSTEPPFMLKRHIVLKQCRFYSD